MTGRRCLDAQLHAPCVTAVLDVAVDFCLCGHFAALQFRYSLVLSVLRAALSSFLKAQSGFE